ncbi:MAG: flagellar hook-length control protein FliK, partial [Oscillospiraceae bacterium]
IAQLSGNAKPNKEQSVKPVAMQNAHENEGKEPTDLQKAQTPFTLQGAKELQGKDGVKLEVLKPEKADAEILANGKLAFETAAAKLRTADSTKADDAQTVKDEPMQKAQKAVEKPIKETAQAEQSAIQREAHLQSLSSAQPLEKEAPVLNKQDLLLQVQQGAMANAKAGKEDFVMRLRPDGMGEITVKLAEADGKMTMQITASNANVQKMLSAEIDNLREAMKPYHVEVREIMQQQTNHFDLGSQNPNANQQHFANQFAYQQNEQKPSLYYSGAAVQQEEMILEEMPQAKPISAMDIYA